jgi:hypothetical protein
LLKTKIKKFKRCRAPDGRRQLSDNVSKGSSIVNSCSKFGRALPFEKFSLSQEIDLSGISFDDLPAGEEGVREGVRRLVNAFRV